METTVKKFRRYVELTGVSMSELANQTGLNWLTIRKILKSDDNLSVSTIEKLNSFLVDMLNQLNRI